VRFFGSFAYPEDRCGDARAIARAYSLGTPMGGALAPGTSGPQGPPRAPRFFVRDRAPGGLGTRLERMQIVKGEVSPVGEARTRVFDVAGKPVDAGVDLESCESSGEGSDSLCAVWTAPDFDPEARGSYYARVLEVPSCRWSHRRCLALAPAQRPAGCSAADLPQTIRSRAWTSPILYRPASR
jgi:hypothetical protein